MAMLGLGRARQTSILITELEAMKKRGGAISKFMNIRVLPSGYQVSIVRAGVEVSRHFAGHSERSWQAAHRFRSRALRELPDKRLNKIPRPILAALGLTNPVVGVFRRGARAMYTVSYRERGRLRSKAFGWKDAGEVEAYAAALAFRRQMMSGEGGRRGKTPPR